MNIFLNQSTLMNWWTSLPASCKAPQKESLNRLAIRTLSKGVNHDETQNRTRNRCHCARSWSAKPRALRATGTWRKLSHCFVSVGDEPMDERRTHSGGRKYSAERALRFAPAAGF